MKKIVWYLSASHPPVVGQPAYLTGVLAHPAGLVGEFVKTSPVVAINGDEIETIFTHYKKVQL